MTNDAGKKQRGKNRVRRFNRWGTRTSILKRHFDQRRSSGAR